MPNLSLSLPLFASDSTKPSQSQPFHFPPHLQALSTFLHHHLSRIRSDIFSHIDDAKRHLSHHSARPLFAASSLHDSWQPKHAFDLALSADFVAKTLAGTSVYTVSNSNNEFVLISDPTSVRSLSLLCFRQEDAEALLSQVRMRQPVLGRGARVVPITLDQVYMLKVEGIAFRFLPDPSQIRNALELRGVDRAKGFDGVPVFQVDSWELRMLLLVDSDLLVVRKKNKRYCPLYFQKEDIERELMMKVSRSSRGPGISQHIVVGSLEDVLKKMEMNDKNSGWDDLIFIPPGKSYSQHLKEVTA